MTSHNSHIEILGGPERHRRWTSAEKLSMVQETYKTGATVSLVARRHGVAPNQLFGWRKLATQGALTATSAGSCRSQASSFAGKWPQLGHSS